MSLTHSEILTTAKSFLDCSLPKAAWTHEAHFAVALALLADGNFSVVDVFPDFVRRYNVSTGTPNTTTSGYHETITLASLMVATAFVRRAKAPIDLGELLKDLMASKFGRSSWILEHWSHEVVFSPLARAQWIAPDLAPLSD